MPDSHANVDERQVAAKPSVNDRPTARIHSRYDASMFREEDIDLNLLECVNDVILFRGSVRRGSARIATFTYNVQTNFSDDKGKEIMRYVYALLVGMLLAAAVPTQAQVNASINIGSQPMWGPTGYDHVEYYYLPEIETYYYVPGNRFYYYDGGRWVNATRLPVRYARYDLFDTYKVVLNTNEPWRNHNSYRSRYITFKGRRGQPFIRDSRDSKYFVNKNHPQHGNWVKQQKLTKANKGNNGNAGLGNKKGNTRNPGNMQKNATGSKGNSGKGNGRNK